MLAEVDHYARQRSTRLPMALPIRRFLARPLAELALKGMIGSTHKNGRDLSKLLGELEQQGHDLFTGTGTEQALIVRFVLDLHKHDPCGDEGRYPVSNHGQPSLESCCCADPVKFRAR